MTEYERSRIADAANLLGVSMQQFTFQVVTKEAENVIARRRRARAAGTGRDE